MLSTVRERGILKLQLTSDKCRFREECRLFACIGGVRSHTYLSREHAPAGVLYARSAAKQTTGLAARSEAYCGLSLRNTHGRQITDGQQITDSRQTADNRQKQITQQADNRRDTIQITDNRQRAGKGGSHGVND